MWAETMCYCTFVQIYTCPGRSTSSSAWAVVTWINTPSLVNNNYNNTVTGTCTVMLTATILTYCTFWLLPTITHSISWATALTYLVTSVFHGRSVSLMKFGKRVLGYSNLMKIGIQLFELSYSQANIQSNTRKTTRRKDDVMSPWQQHKIYGFTMWEPADQCQGQCCFSFIIVNENFTGISKSLACVACWI